MTFLSQARMITISPGEEKEFQRLVSSVSGLCAFCEEIHLFSWDFSLLYHCGHNCTKLPEQISSLGLDQRASMWGEEVEFWWSCRCAWHPLAYAELRPELALSYYPSALLLVQLPAPLWELFWVYWSCWLWELHCLSLLSSCDYSCWGTRKCLCKGESITE